MFSSLTVNVSPFLVGLTTYFVIVVVGRKLGGCNNSLTVKTFNVIGHLIFVMIVVIVKLGRKVRPVTKCGFKTGLCKQIGGILELAVVCTATIAAFNFLINVLIPSLIINVFASSTRLARLSIAKLHVAMVFFPVVNFRVIASGFFRDVNVTNGTVFLSLAQRVLVLLPYLLILPRFFKITKI